MLGFALLSPTYKLMQEYPRPLWERAEGEGDEYNLRTNEPHQEGME